MRRFCRPAMYKLLVFSIVIVIECRLLCGFRDGYNEGLGGFGVDRVPGQKDGGSRLPRSRSVPVHFCGDSIEMVQPVARSRFAIHPVSIRRPMTRRLSDIFSAYESVMDVAATR